MYLQGTHFLPPTTKIDIYGRIPDFHFDRPGILAGFRISDLAGSEFRPDSGFLQTPQKPRRGQTDCHNEVIGARASAPLDGV